MKQQYQSIEIDSIKPWALSQQEVTKALQVEVDEGLSDREVAQRRRKFGANRLKKAKRRTIWAILFDQFKSLLVVLLAAAAAVSLIFGETIDALAIIAVILINSAIGFFTELRAVRSMEALQQLGRVEARVRRAGRIQQIAAEKLVAGDIVLLDSGDVVTADVRLVKASRLQADESALTGESVAVSKMTDPVEGKSILAERASMLYKGTSITRGSGEGVVTATGMATELGHISSLVEEAEEEITPLEKRLDKLGHRLVWGTLVAATLIALVGLLIGKPPLLIVETAIALAVATVPEGLPIVATIALARGMWRMSQRNALVRHLSAVETLGSTTVILTDKTGTLTENEMSMVAILVDSSRVQIEENNVEGKAHFKNNGNQIDPIADPILAPVLEVGMLCNNASVGDRGQSKQPLGDPTEVALLEAAIKAGLDRKKVIADKPEVREVAFDPELKMMATFHQENGSFQVAVKGAPEAILLSATAVLTRDGERNLNESGRQKWKQRSDEMAQEGLRVLALASKNVSHQDASPYEDLTLLGLVGLLDPPRDDVSNSIEACRQAGIRIVMVTGDQPLTAQNIARAVNLVDDEKSRVIKGQEMHKMDSADSDDTIEQLLDNPIFARVEPKQKLDLVAAHQDDGDIVAMTGDGVNDAPALKKADIGIAMGKRGTQVAREAADMVLKDDAFSSIIAAVEGGRAIFNNIRKFVVYLLSCNVSEVLIVALASLVNAPLPVNPLQILYLNLVTDVFPALALGVGEGDASLMKRPPRDPNEPLLLRHHWRAIGGYSFLITLAVLAAFAIALLGLDMNTQRAVTISFLTLAAAQLWHVFNLRSVGSGLFNNEVSRNPFIWAALGLCVILLIAAVYLPGLSKLLATVDPQPAGWVLALGMSVLPLIIGQMLKEFGWGNV